jgi:peptide chain release factor 1
MKDKIEKIIAEYDALQAEFVKPEILSDMEAMKDLGKKKAKIEDTALMAKKFLELEHTRDEAKEMLDDPEMKDLAKEEIAEAEKEMEKFQKILKEDLTPKDPNDPKNIILEVRAGAGGDEAGIFAGDLMRMYFRFAEEKDFSIEIMDKTDNESGGIKEVVAEISGKNAYKFFKYESGVHRVQRIPKTETQGRIHTSTATVAIIPEADETEELEIAKNDVRVDTYRASGAGGQHVNKTESAIRLTHLPTGLVVTCQDGKSQHKNKEQAFKVLASRLKQLEQEKLIAENSEARVAQIGTGDRSEKIRTYNYPQDRITDHRIKKNFPNIPAVMDGALTPLIEACALANDELQQ